jgi:hypothetical protein
VTFTDVAINCVSVYDESSSSVRQLAGSGTKARHDGQVTVAAFVQSTGICLEGHTIDT